MIVLGAVFLLLLLKDGLTEDEEITLGPNSEQSEYCSIGTGGFQQPLCSDPPLHEQAGDRYQDVRPQAMREKSRGVLSVFSSAKEFLWEVPKAAFNRVYNVSSEALLQFAEMVRVVFNEETYNILNSAMQSLLYTVTTPDHLLGKAVLSLSRTTMSVSIFLFCLLLNYILLRVFYLRFIIVFDCVVLLLHKILGPDFIILGFMNLSYNVYRAAWWMMVQHTYVFATVMVSFFMLSLLWPLVRRMCWRSTTDVMLDIELRLKAVQEKQKVMEERQKVMEERQREILSLLRQLKREGSVSAVANHEE